MPDAPNPAAAPNPGAVPAPTAAPTPAVAPTSAVATPAAPPAPVKIKFRKPRQRACDEKDEKGKVCCGHLKRWYDYPKEIEIRIGQDAEIYRCENCKVRFRPNPADMPHSYTQRF